MNTNILGRYKNGNYTVTILSDGTKIRRTEDDIFLPAFAENCDVKITDRCDGGCEMCYEGCTPTGKHADLLGAKFIDTLHPYTELALNGNDMSHSDLIPFLEKLKVKKIIANLTVNQVHFERHFDYIKSLVDRELIYGLGISLRKPTAEFIEKVKQFPNAVIHTINGILTPADVEALMDKDLKILILGYKVRERGIDFFYNHQSEIEANQEWLNSNLTDLPSHFKCVSFDNLAIEQLNVRRLMTEDEWNEFYMGDDGGYTFYIDMVDKKFARNSVSDKRYDMLDSIDEMFKMIQKESKNQ